MIQGSSTEGPIAISSLKGAISYSPTMTSAGRIWESALCWAVDGLGKSYQIISVCTYSVAGTLHGTHQQLIKTESFRLSDGRPVDRITEDEFKVLTDGLALRRVSASPAMNSNT